MYLLAQLWLYLLLAGLLGLAVGALVFRSCTRSRWLALEAERNDALQAQARLADRLASAGEAPAGREQWRSKMLELEGALAAAHGKIATRDTESNQLRALADEHALEASRLRSELASFHTELDKVQAEWQGELARLEGELASARSRAAQGSVQSVEQSGEVARLRAWSDEHAGESERLRSQLQESQAAAAAARNAFEQEIAVLRGQVASRGALEEAARSAEQWKTTARALEADLAALRKEHLRRVGERTDEAAHLRQEVQLVRGQLETAHAQATANKQAFEAELSALRNELAAREEGGVAGQTPERWRTTALQLDADLALAREQIDELSAEVARLSTAASAVSALTEWSRRDAALSGATSGLSDWDAGLSEVESMVAALEAKADSDASVLLQPAGRAVSAAASMSPGELELAVREAGEGVAPPDLVNRPDDLKQIGGIGPENETWLHSRGIFRFAQIAGWTPAEVAWVARNLPTYGARVYRENWVDQAARLARGELTKAKATSVRGELP